MKLPNANCEYCLTPHTDDFCNDGHKTTNSCFICARYFPKIPVRLTILQESINYWWYEVQPISKDEVDTDE